GDKKLYSDEVATLAAFSQGPWEDGKADASTNYPTGFGRWTKGFVFEHTFGGDIMNAVGPFSLDVDSSITVVWVEGGGYRLEGVQQALYAARWAYQNAWGVAPGGYNEAVLPTPPPAPIISVSGAPTGKVRVRWDNGAESDPDFRGYKIWRAQPFPKFITLNGGMRGLDRYQEQMNLGETEATYLKPVNPKFDATSEVQTPQQADSWGPYRLVKVIPTASKGTYADASGQFDYSYEDTDEDVLQGFTYWYYVSAYAEKSGGYTGPGGATTTRIESHKVNVNGRSGLWMGTYPFANSNFNAFYPRDVASQRALGSAFVLAPDVPAAADVASGNVKIFVKPNPYKRTALFDVGLEHKIAFNNIPDQSKITILDVAGQIVFQQTITSPTSGTFFWDLFSKDGMEVANGLYIYIVEYPGGMERNYFAIMR
ncbi:MAG: T9SS type A sorting domain-containing protein, partial [Ignavibacteriales bacterium]|nr:T9SS type A sorting domain-containing protein [Ignavibacteriales bacterium]